MAEERKILVRQTKSGNGRNERVRATLAALGLGKVGKQREHTVNPALLGMIGKVNHLVLVKEIK